MGLASQPPLRIVSLQPSISLVLQDLGCLHLLVACTKYCVEAVPALSQLPVQVIHDAWSAKTEEILSTHPNLVLASVPYRMESLAEIMRAGVAALTLAPHSLANIYEDIALLGGIVRNGAKADHVVHSMKAALLDLQTRAETASDRPLVYCEEWGKPIIHSQRWVDELIEMTGGRTFETPGATTDEDRVRLADPDVMIFAWCGAGDRVPLEKLVVARGWREMRAVQQNRVHCIPDAWLNTPAPSLLNGARAIAAAVHPKIFHDLELPRRLRSSSTDPSTSKME